MTAARRHTLLDSYDGIVCDLDGVVYRGPEPVPDAVAALVRARETRPVVYATNNASRTSAIVAAQLGALGITVTSSDVVTSAQAGAVLLAKELDAGACVLAIGGPGVPEALLAHGLEPVTPAAFGVRAVLQGYGPAVTAADLAEAAFAVAQGATWVATNTDRTLPTDRGIAPGNGTLVAAVATATGASPTVVGKPFPPLYELATQVLGTSAATTLAIGDRLDTDIVGAQRAGMDSAWVLTGVDGLGDLAASSATPTYTLVDLSELHESYEVSFDGAAWVADGVRVCRADGTVVVEPIAPQPDSLDYARRVLRAGSRLVCAVRDGTEGAAAASEVAVTLARIVGDHARRGARQ